ncbi:hypothetical protein [Deinococcus sp.]|uniref:hypothetical protein n=1 Tax=Deinococcus sp. TaxID=47478 RepID=UPI0025E75608|nr:hypothetical protein [Deinococcus sp.]
MQECLTVTTAQQARLLLSLRNAQILGALIGQPEGAAGLSAAEVTLEVPTPLKAVHRTLGQLLSAGLIEQTGLRPRAGRSCKLYTARARSYQVPLALSDAAGLRELLDAAYRPFLDAFGRHQEGRLLDQGLDTVRLSLIGSQLLYSLVGPQGTALESGTYGHFSATILSPAHAGELQAELRSLGEKYRQSDPDGQPYLLGMLFSPGELES